MRSENVGARLAFGVKLHNLQRLLYYAKKCRSQEEREVALFNDTKVGAPVVVFNTATNSRINNLNGVIARLAKAVKWKIKQLGVPAPGGTDGDTL